MLQNIQVNDNFAGLMRYPEGGKAVASVEASDAGLTTEYFPSDIYVNPVRW
jgi:hypothetical protein